jgi:hypothetical protein
MSLRCLKGLMGRMNILSMRRGVEVKEERERVFVVEKALCRTYSKMYDVIRNSSFPLMLPYQHHKTIIKKMPSKISTSGICQEEKPFELSCKSCSITCLLIHCNETVDMLLLPVV